MSDLTDPKFHRLDTRGVGLSSSLNDPFDYTPHPLCRAAAREVVHHLGTMPHLAAELDQGKMLGVLVVRDPRGEVGFLAAFSGNLAGTNNHPYFVPPVCDMLAPDGFFRPEEAAISQINKRIESLEASGELFAAKRRLQELETESRQQLSQLKAGMARNKELRNERRASTDDPQILETIDNESRHERSQLHRLKIFFRTESENARKELESMQAEIDRLKSERRRRSEALQREIFSRFEIVNSRLERKNLLDIFAEAEGTLPPAGAGECAAPKLLQYAFLNRLTPLSIAEFWFGRSPSGELRRHGSFYPACRAKCKPILGFMLEGLSLERRQRTMPPQPKVLFEDEALLVVEKPAGMLSVEGKIECPSVERWAAERYAGTAEPRVVHRLDMDVSGLLLIAKQMQSYRNLQEQFLHRTVKKRYVALLEGCIAADGGEIGLPLRPDPADRPRQVVDPQHGKAALTRFRVAERRPDTTLVKFEPVTGRTHQLRVHAASAEGLNAPIAGDTLYGAQPARRLFLHNEFIAFAHPVTGEHLEFHSVLPPEEAF